MSLPGAGPASGWRPGAQVGEWILGEKLGAGGMGVVFSACHLGTQSVVAIKVLASGVDQDVLLRFQREGEAQARVDDHPAILRIHAAGQAWGRPYLVLEFAPGGDLGARLRHGPLPPERARALLTALASGVEHLHQAGILHRDLKPENVLFDDEGRPRLTDFGLARFAGAESLTATGALLGTPAYMAPEQAQGQKPDARTDVYALGALLFACLTGRPPVEGPSVLVILARAIEDTPPAPSSLARGVPADLDAVCARAMAKDPSARYPSAADFREALLVPTDPAKARISGLVLGGAALVLLALLGAAGAATLLRPSPLPTPAARVSRAPSLRQTSAPKRVRHALDPDHKRERVERRHIAPNRLEFVAPGRLLTRRLPPSSARNKHELLELWEVDLDGKLSKLWEEQDPRSAVVRGGRLFWVEIKEDHSLVFEAATNFPTLSEAYPDCSLPHSAELVYVSPREGLLAWRDRVNPHSGKLHLYDLKRSHSKPCHERDAISATWLGESVAASTRLANRGQAITPPTLFVTYVVPTGLAKKSCILTREPQALWGTDTAVWVGFADGSLLEVPHRAEERERSYAHAPAGRASDDFRGARIRALRSTPGHLFATAHSNSTPAHSQLLAWGRAPGVSAPTEVLRFPRGSFPGAFCLDPALGLVAVRVGNAPAEELWVLRLHTLE